MNNMRNKILSLLVLLLTAATGAWAEETLLVTINSTDYKTFTSGSMTFDDKVTVTFSSSVSNYGTTDGWAAYGTESPLTVTGINGYTITSCKFYTKEGTATTGYTVEGESPSVYLFNGEVYTDANLSVYIGEPGVNKIEVYGVAPAPAVEVTTNAASEGATFTEATFQMPAFDATADYELVRDMSVQMTAQVGTDPQAQPRYRVKKQDNKFIPADMEMAAVPALFTVNDAIEQKALTQTQDYIVQIYAIDAEGQPTGEPMTFATFTFEPGIYAVKAVAATGSDYDGETALSNTFKLFQGYEVEVAAKEFITYYKDEPLYADTETSADAQLYTIQSVSGDQAQLSAAIQTAPSYTPLLIFNNSDQDKTFLLIPANAEPDLALTVAPEFKGTLTDRDFTADDMAAADYYTLSGGKLFVPVYEAGTIAANKCWLQFDHQQTPGARNITIMFEDATGIDSMVNGQWSMDTWYDLQGRRVQKATKGVFIRNGRKVVVK